MPDFVVLHVLQTVAVTVALFAQRRWKETSATSPSVVVRWLAIRIQQIFTRISRNQQIFTRISRNPCTKSFYSCKELRLRERREISSLFILIR